MAFLRVSLQVDLSLESLVAADHRTLEWQLRLVFLHVRLQISFFQEHFVAVGARRNPIVWIVQSLVLHELLLVRKLFLAKDARMRHLAVVGLHVGVVADCKERENGNVRIGQQFAKCPTYESSEAYSLWQKLQNSKCFCM